MAVNLENENRRLSKRVAELESPFILTDEPPTVPGWYMFEENGEHIDFVRVVKEPSGGVAILTFDVYFSKAYSAVSLFPDAKWGSAPLPIPEGE